jgi:hypothetical protein
MSDYLDKPPQRFNLVAARNERGIIEIEAIEGKWVKFADMDLYMFEGSQLIMQLLAKHKALEAAADEVLRVYMPQFNDSRAVDDGLVGLAAAVAGINCSVPAKTVCKP